MGRIIVEQIVSADGFAQDADGGMKFVEPGAENPDGDQGQLGLLAGVDAIVLGRRTYELFAGFWPTVTASHDPVAGPINTLPKHVVTNTLDRAPWGDGEVAVETGDGVETVRRLAAHYDGDLIVWGSLTLADALFTAGAVDILRLRLTPSIIGAGRGATPTSLTQRSLRLERSEAHAGGQVTLQYAVLPAT